MGEANSTYGGEVRTGFWRRNLKERDNLEDPDVDWGIILKWIFRMWDRGMEWIKLALCTDRWWALVNAVMNLWVQ
jgi:hypothetical protein